MAEEESVEPVIEEPEPQAPPDFLLFGKWSTSDIEIKDIGLARYITLKPVLIPHTSG